MQYFKKLMHPTIEEIEAGLEKQMLLFDLIQKGKTREF